MKITKGVLQNCNGSSLLELDSDKIYAGIKLEVGSTKKDGIINLRIDSILRQPPLPCSLTLH